MGDGENGCDGGDDVNNTSNAEMSGVASAADVNSVETDIEKYKRNFQLWHSSLLSAASQVDKVRLMNPDEALQVNNRVYLVPTYLRIANKLRDAIRRSYSYRPTRIYVIRTT